MKAGERRPATLISLLFFACVTFSVPVLSNEKSSAPPFSEVLAVGLSRACAGDR
jgi:hypothetical protein